MKFGFPKSCRLLSRSDFSFVKRSSCCHLGLYCKYVYRWTKSRNTRIGITVFKKYGKSHERNLFKRHTREIFRTNKDKLPDGININIYPRMNRSSTFEHLKRDFMLFSTRVHKFVKLPR